MKKLTALILIIICAFLAACTDGADKVDLSSIPAFSGKPYAELNGNMPSFTDKQKESTEAFEKYSRLDELGRCGAAFANVCVDTMPTEERESISSVKPTGWNQKAYTFIEDGYVYNRCHLIGFQLTGENANERNLITGTRYMNVKGMLPFENEVADYVASTGRHVLYRVTPIFDGENLVANGVQMEAWSVEDKGYGVCFNVYCYNVQPGVVITYASGKNKSDGTLDKITGKSSTSGSKSDTRTAKKEKAKKYVLNTNTKKFHFPDCDSVYAMHPDNKKEVKAKRSELIEQGYSPCGDCKP